MDAFLVDPSVTSVTLDSGLEGFTRAGTNTTREFCGGRTGVGFDIARDDQERKYPGGVGSRWVEV